MTDHDPRIQTQRDQAIKEIGRLLAGSEKDVCLTFGASESDADTCRHCGFVEYAHVEKHQMIVVVDWLIRATVAAVTRESVEGENERAGTGSTLIGPRERVSADKDHTTGESVEGATEKDLGAALLPVDPSASVKTEALPNSDPGPWQLLSALVAIDSQKTVAERYDISPQYLCDILKGRREISVQLAKRLGYRRVIVFEKVGSGTQSTQAERAPATPQERSAQQEGF